MGKEAHTETVLNRIAGRSRAVGNTLGSVRWRGLRREEASVSLVQ